MHILLVRVWWAWKILRRCTPAVEANPESRDLRPLGTGTAPHDDPYLGDPVQGTANSRTGTLLLRTPRGVIALCGRKQTDIELTPLNESFMIRLMEVVSDIDIPQKDAFDQMYVTTYCQYFRWFFLLSLVRITA